MIKSSAEGPPEFPSVTQLLTSGGDSRILCNPQTGLNQYGCAPAPEPAILSYGSSTASTISAKGFDAAVRLRERLKRAAGTEAPSATYAFEMARMREELIRLGGLGELDPDIIFAASGTDLHLFVPQLLSASRPLPLLAVIAEAAETGSGVYGALSGRHFSERAPFAPSVADTSSVDGGHAVEIAAAPCRESDGTLRPAATIDNAVQVLAEQAIAAGRHVLLVLIDSSKTGNIAPSPACALALKQRFAGRIDILVDACQFRISPSTLRAYLQHDCMVAITGSKFVGGPAFSGALLVPGAIAARLSTRALPPGLNAYSVQADWPEDWSARRRLADGYNYGLLLRWEAALAEMRAFRALPEAAVAAFLTSFAAAISRRLATDPAFEPLPVPAVSRTPFATPESWDSIQTIFPFLLRRPGSGYLTCRETLAVYENLRRNGCHIGQPVSCGMRHNAHLSALRLCFSMRLAADAIAPGGRGVETVIAEALSLLDKTALLAAY